MNIDLPRTPDPFKVRRELWCWRSDIGKRVSVEEATEHPFTSTRCPHTIVDAQIAAKVRGPIYCFYGCGLWCDGSARMTIQVGYGGGPIAFEPGEGVGYLKRLTGG